MADYDEVYASVSEMLCEAKDLELNELTPDMPLYQLKLDSLDYVELMVLARKAFNVTIEADVFASNINMTLGELCRYLSDKSH